MGPSMGQCARVWSVGFCDLRRWAGALVTSLLLLWVAPGCRGAEPGPDADSKQPAHGVAVRITWEESLPEGGVRPLGERSVRVQRGIDVVSATRHAVEVEQRYLCCDERDVWSVAGIGPDPRRDRYWMWLLDGELGPATAADYALEGGEHITWRLTAGSVPGTLGQSEPLVVLDAGAHQALWQIGAEGFSVAQRSPLHGPGTFAEGARALGATWALATSDPGPEWSEALSAAGLELVLLPLQSPDPTTRLPAFEHLGHRTHRPGPARIAARL